MKYVILSTIFFVLCLYALKTSAKKPEQKIKDKLYRIHHVCTADDYYYINHNTEENIIYANRIAEKVSKELRLLTILYKKLADTVLIKNHLSTYIQNWSAIKIAASLSQKDGRFISDTNYLLQFYSYRHKRKWVTLYKIYRA